MPRDVRILEQLGGCPTNNDRIFYYPQVEVNGEWKSIDFTYPKGTGAPNGVQIVQGLTGWGEIKNAQEVNDLYLKTNG